VSTNVNARSESDIARPISETEFDFCYSRDIAEAYKQPMYYAMGHFSKYVTENSVRVSNSGKKMKTLEVLSVLRPDDKIVLVVYNR